jgi:hypothetical protein
MLKSDYMATASHDIQPSLPQGRPEGYSQQHIEGLAGIERRILCAPTAFYKLAEEMGYHIPLPDYVSMIRQELDGSTGDDGWNRAKLCQTLREEWGVSSVSCWTKTLGHPVSDENIEKMQTAGYLSDSPMEVDFLKDVMATVSEGPRGVIDLIKKGIPLVTTVEPGFAENKAKHAVVVEGFDTVTNSIKVFDPDERNQASSYPIEWMEYYLSPDGGTTIMFPPPPKDQYIQ